MTKFQKFLFINLGDEIPEAHINWIKKNFYLEQLGIILSVILIMSLGFFLYLFLNKETQVESVTDSFAIDYSNPSKPKQQKNKPPVEVKEYWIRSGDSYSIIFKKLKVPHREAYFYEKHVTHFFPTILKPGQRIIAETYKDSNAYFLHSFALQTRDNENLHFLERIITNKKGNTSLDYFYESIWSHTDTSMIRGKVKESFEETLYEITDSKQLSYHVASIWSWDPEFNRINHKGDSLEVLVETLYDRYDRPSGYGTILAARYLHGQMDNWAIRYSDGSKSGYFTSEGKSVQGFLLKAPLDYNRISSHFSSSRYHPILKVKRPHWGVDYAAPRGTKIIAAGDGVVEYSKWVSGYGKTIKVRHNEIFTTYYGHLRNYALGIKPGTEVKRGQVIGFVGTTGLSTGPHLDYRVERYGQYINPEAMENSLGNLEVVDAVEFGKVVQEIQGLMDFTDVSTFAKTHRDQNIVN